ncbi:type IV secretion system protein [Legionella feeleii]|uniref:Protein LvhB6 n=1 Tax=Legionella feeleii TaxID=453 RepID=A0A378J4U8_9GAMM|nr:type IV secretion system protein [Legionella feeleii]STX39294.1 protein LvhB6 [Legionella feeleii]
MDFRIAPATFINDILRIVDALTADFIKSGFEAIANNWLSSGLLTSILTLYVLYFLYQVQFYNTPPGDAITHLIKVCLVFLISTNWATFYVLIFNVATNEPIHIIKLLLAGKAGSSDGSLNDTFTTGIAQAMSLLGHMPFSFKGVVCTILAAVLLLLGTFLFTMLALSLIVISKFYLAVMLALAPYFLTMFLFNGTKGLSESWVKSCLNNALIPVFVGCILLLTSLLAKACLHTGASVTATPKGPDFAGVIIYFFASVLSAFLFKTIPEKAASLTASLAIAGAGRMSGYAQALSSNLTGGAARAYKGFAAAKDNFSHRQQTMQQEIRQRTEARRAQLEEVRAKRARSGY